MNDKKLVGLCIVHKNYNYGSILQSYATLIKLEELGVDYEIINYHHPKTASFYFNAIKRFRSKDTVYSKIRSIKRKTSKKIHPKYAHNDSIRAKKFESFISSKFLRFTRPINDYNELQKYAERYTDVLVGSDQLWLPSGLDTNFYNLMFASDRINKIAYSASFGVSTIPKYQREKTKSFLERIQNISVREKAGQRIVKDLTGKTIPIVLDPTMIITKEQWDKNIKDSIIVNGKYILCYLLGNNPTQRKEIAKLSKKKNMKIVILRHLDEYIPTDEKFGDIALYNVGPEEFVNLIRHATYVCTDSFHGSVFSIIYHKQFISFSRYAEGKNSRNSRLETLFNNIGISRWFAGDILKIEEKIDWNSADNHIKLLRKKSSEFIEKALGIDKNIELCKTEDGLVKGHTICEKTDCTGCSVCAAVCPKKAISIRMDNCGFFRPVIDNNKCINCNACNRVCPVNNQPKTYSPTKVFAFQNTDEIRFNSTSGGFFYAIACKIIDEGGVVCGAAFDEKMMLRHTIVDNKENLGPLQKSKYVQSSVDGIYQMIKEYLNDGRKVLFVGTGCQVAAVRNYIGEHNKLLLVDLVCHGVPSSGMFQDWIKYLEKKYKRVVNVYFRDKSYGYATPNAKVLFSNGKYIESCRDSDVYRNLFFRHLSIRESCYNCRFKTIDRTSDITIGDLWNIGLYDISKDDNKGSTCVFIHTKEGISVCRNMGLINIPSKNIFQEDAKNMVTSVSPAFGVQSFWRLYQEQGFETLVDKYEKNTIKRKAKSAAKRIMNKSKLSSVIYKMKDTGKR